MAVLIKSKKSPQQQIIEIQASASRLRTRINQARKENNHWKANMLERMLVGKYKTISELQLMIGNDSHERQQTI